MTDTKDLKPGHYWAKLITPTRMPVGEDWASVDWEIVQVWDNNGPPGDPEEFGVHVPGVSVTQWPKDLVFGPRVELQTPVDAKTVRPGWYWAKYRTPTPEVSANWEIVHVDGFGSRASVYCNGMEQSCRPSDFVWGARVDRMELPK